MTGAPNVLTKIVQKMMAPIPDNRFPTCKAVSQALRQEARALKGEGEEPTVLVSQTPTPPIPGEIHPFRLLFRSHNPRPFLIPVPAGRG